MVIVVARVTCGEWGVKDSEVYSVHWKWTGECMWCGWMSERERSRSAEVRSSERPSSGYPIGRPKHQAREGCTVDNLVREERNQSQSREELAASDRAIHPSSQPAIQTAIQWARQPAPAPGEAEAAEAEAAEAVDPSSTGDGRADRRRPVCRWGTQPVHFHSGVPVCIRKNYKSNPIR